MVRKSTLISVSGPATDPECKLSEDAFMTFESLLKASISDYARRDLIKLCNGLLLDLWAAENVATIEAVQKALKPYRKATTALWDLMNHSADSDADREAEHRFMTALLANPTLVPAEKIELMAGELVSVADPEGSGHVMHITGGVFRNFIFSMVAALDTVEATLKKERTGEGSKYFNPSQNLKNFLHLLQKWAKENELPHAPYKMLGKYREELPSPFTRFVFALHRELGKQAPTLPNISTEFAVIDLFRKR
jgi:hypothetical protein